ncbi:MAG: molybdopterin molybdotransferase MoeA [Candidatus Methanofastidiosa archaeon]|nr:molybdopterin molybdotransferase MoeA [Candidatus Methanofastidiosa archaeon]
MGAFKRLMSYGEALSAVCAARIPLASRDVATTQALGCLLAEDVVAPSDSPPFDRAAMDGYAVRAADTFAATAGAPVTLPLVASLAAGDVPSQALHAGEAMRIMTGAQMPPGADAVVMQEHAVEVAGSVRMTAPVVPLTHVSQRGEDIAAGATVLAAGSRLSPHAVALLISLGVRSCRVWTMPSVAVVTTGDELVAYGDEVPAGKIIDSNGPMLSAILGRCGCPVTYRAHARDSPDEITAALAAARAMADIVLVTGGSSFGERDYAQRLVAGLDIHGVAIKPGKPFGFAPGPVPVFLLSGYPVAAFVQIYLFVIPYLEALTGATILSRVTLPLAEGVSTSLGRAEVVRASVRDGTVVPLRRSGSSRLTSLAWAEGYVLSSPLREGMGEGDKYLFTSFLE